MMRDCRENIALARLLPFAIAAALAVAGPAAAHDYNGVYVVHPGLTDDAISALGDGLLSRYRSDMLEGSIDEDDAGPEGQRICYHAFNPVTGRGWCPQPFCAAYAESGCPHCPWSWVSGCRSPSRSGRCASSPMERSSAVPSSASSRNTPPTPISSGWWRDSSALSSRRPVAEGLTWPAILV